MSADSPYARLIAELGQTLGIAGLAPSAEGICQLVFDGRQVVQVVHVGAHGLVLVSCRLADHLIDAPQAERMARANFTQEVLAAWPANDAAVPDPSGPAHPL